MSEAPSSRTSGRPSVQVELLQKRSKRAQLAAELDRLRAENKKQIEAEARVRAQDAQPNQEAFDPKKLASKERELRQVVSDLREVSGKADQFARQHQSRTDAAVAGPRGSGFTVAEALDRLNSEQIQHDDIKKRLKETNEKVALLTAQIAKRAKEISDLEDLLKSSRMHGLPKEALPAYQQLEIERLTHQHRKLGLDLEQLKARVLPIAASASDRLSLGRQSDRLQSQLLAIEREMRTFFIKGQSQKEAELRRLEDEQGQAARELGSETDEVKTLESLLSLSEKKIESFSAQSGPMARLSETAEQRKLSEAQESLATINRMDMQKLQERRQALATKEQSIRAEVRVLRSQRDTSLQKQPQRGEAMTLDVQPRIRLLEQQISTLDREIAALNQRSRNF